MEITDILLVMFIVKSIFGAIAVLMWIMEKGINKWEKASGKTLEQTLRSWEEQGPHGFYSLYFNEKDNYYARIY